jgi:glycine dehydrogenase
MKDTSLEQTVSDSKPADAVLPRTDLFVQRHLGPRQGDIRAMLELLGFSSLDEFIGRIVPQSIAIEKPLSVGNGDDEHSVLRRLREIARQNQVFRSYIGMGYHDCITPAVIQRNILENPGWYTQYTPYQPEISQGRLEALLNFQTMIMDLTGMEIANSSLLDEGTAAAEAMHMSYGLFRGESNSFFVSDMCHPQTIDVVRTRAWALGIEVIVGKHGEFDFSKPVFGVLLQYPASDGGICDYSDFIEKANKAGAIVTMASDLLSLALLTPPGELGADIAIGSTQRFGIPLGFGGPHAAYFATRESFKRSMPGRLVGVSKDSNGKPALRLSLQTREQHIRREKATSNICTAQVLLAVMAGMYAVYHGPSGVREIALRVHRLTALLAAGLRKLGLEVEPKHFFDTVKIKAGEERCSEIIAEAEKRSINLRLLGRDSVGVSLNEATTAADVEELWSVFSSNSCLGFTAGMLAENLTTALPATLLRKSEFLRHPIFNRYHSETEMLRYIKRLESRDLSLTTAMIPLGSCTMKLNAAVEMFPISWPEFSMIHPFAPPAQSYGYQLMFEQLEQWLADITGFDSVSLQPNAGSQGEYAGLLVIRKYHEDRRDGYRNICLIPQSAHGTNPASAVMAGMKVVVVACDANGNIDVADLEAKAVKHAANLAALMVTYPSTHGVFEEEIKNICRIIHQHGGQVYMDGANMNAQVGLCRPAEIGADVCHLNLHKTFCIPHGGGGPGMGPIGVAKHLAALLPRHPVVEMGGANGIGAVSASPWGSASILPISWVYIALMGSEGLTEATRIAILNANYIAGRLDAHYPVLYKGKNGLVAHECILDLRPVKKSAGIEVDDIAKRLMDYGFHAPTVSFPVAGTLMVEPTESESKEEMDRFCDAMISIRKEIAEIEAGRMDPHDNPLKNAPHTAEFLTAAEWNHPYSREQAGFPSAAQRAHKFWPAVGRVDNVYGDRNLVCSCLPVEEYGNS